MKLIIKTLFLVLFFSVFLGFFFHFANRHEYEILKPVVIYEEDSSSWGIIMGVKNRVFKNIEKNWQKKYTNERK
ncbi:MAG: hypothetical protein IPG24_19205 [Leptospiraceae bacterium]|nr:hypothetical protein [Leptospiraceae bacterium]